ncbi:MAG TPA: VOC family protein [Pirellulaceae bacterium]|jgi:catechol 2,3-dioxygenase-like lactoylglutathione lyase family enzyme|nr:VOC family protein [Pirellulaceae bacterium]
MSDEIESLVSRYDRGVINRRQLLSALAALAAMPVTAHSAESEAKAPAFEAKSLNHVTLSVSNVQKSKEFYSSILGVSTVSKQKSGINLGLGDSFLGLYPIKEPPRINHFCVGLDEYQVQVAAERLRQFGISPFVRKDKPEVYFKDPDGITVQLESKDYRG